MCRRPVVDAPYGFAMNQTSPMPLPLVSPAAWSAE
jgi:hypothetical protein